MSSTQVEIELLRNMGASCIHLGQQYHQYADFLSNGAGGAIVGTQPPAASGATLPPPFPLAATAGAPATPPATTGRKRRTKAEIAADEAAVAAGFVDAADMAARQAAGSLPPANVPQAPGVPGNLPPPMPGTSPVTPPPPAPPTANAPPPPPATTPHDNLQAALMAFGQAVENTWPGQGHGNGQMGLITKKMGVPNITAIPAENVQQWIDWIVGITAAFRADPSKLSTLTA